MPGSEQASSFYAAIRLLRLFASLCVFILLAGCQEPFYTGLAEQDVNEMMALLRENGIDVRKEHGEKNAWNLTVDGDQLAAAVALLEKAGLPRARYESMGHIFKKDGIIASPLEEKARFIFALSQEVAGTLAQIDGVLAARVHIVLPQEDALGERITPSSASLFIKHKREVDMQPQVHQIKKLVENSIQGLKYDAISVFLFPTLGSHSMQAPSYRSILGIKVAPESATAIYVLVSFCSVLVLGSCAFGVYFILQRKRMVNDAA